MAHRWYDEVYGGLPYADVLIHAGDALTFGKAAEFYNFANWMARQPHPIKIYVGGNHDFFVQGNMDLCRSTLRASGIHLLIDESMIIRGVLPEEDLKVYGTPWIPNLSTWAFYAHQSTLEKKFRDIPADTNILITHTPPSGILDYYPGQVLLIDGPDPHGLESDEYNDEKGLHVGSVALLKRVTELPELKLHVFGHVHSAAGTERYSMVSTSSAVFTKPAEPIFVNACMCFAGNIPGRRPIVVEI